MNHFSVQQVQCLRWRMWWYEYICVPARYSENSSHKSQICILFPTSFERNPSGPLGPMVITEKYTLLTWVVVCNWRNICCLPHCTW